MGVTKGATGLASASDGNVHAGHHERAFSPIRQQKKVLCSALRKSPKTQGVFAPLPRHLLFSWCLLIRIFAVA